MRAAHRDTMTRQPDPDDRDAREAAASYVASFTTELALIARQHGLDTLGYLLEMARMEAESHSRRPDAQH